MVKRLGSSPVNISIADMLTPQQLKQSHFYNQRYFKEQRILWPILTRRQRNYLKKIWDDAIEEAGRLK